MFVGGEVVYRRLFDGLEFNRLAGRALFLGPMFYGKLSALVGIRRVEYTGSWTFSRAEGALDLVNFERHSAALQIGYHL
jgi:hypothetical protein